MQAFLWFSPSETHSCACFCWDVQLCDWWEWSWTLLMFNLTLCCWTWQHTPEHFLEIKLESYNTRFFHIKEDFAFAEVFSYHRNSFMLQSQIKLRPQLWSSNSWLIRAAGPAVSALYWWCCDRWMDGNCTRQKMGCSWRSLTGIMERCWKAKASGTPSCRAFLHRSTITSVDWATGKKLLHNCPDGPKPNLAQRLKELFQQRNNWLHTFPQFRCEVLHPELRSS